MLQAANPQLLGLRNASRLQVLAAVCFSSCCMLESSLGLLMYAHTLMLFEQDERQQQAAKDGL